MSRKYNISEVYPNSPLSVKVSNGETLFFAENGNLGIFATGASRDEAIRAFCEHVVHFYEHYKRLNCDCAIGEASRLKKVYEDLFDEVGACQD